MTEEKITGVDIDKLEAEFEADPTKFVPLARAYLERHLPVQAIQVCKIGLKNSPDTPDGLLALAMAYYHNYDDHHAAITLNQVLKSNPDLAVAHRTLGEIFLERGQEQKAISKLLHTLELEPRDMHTRALLKSLEENVPPLKTSDGQPEQIWIPRQGSIPRETSRPIWDSLVQVGLVTLVVIIFLIWYNHHVDVRVQVRNYIDKASKLIPRDNFKDLITAEQELDAALALNDDEEKAVVRQAGVRSLLWQDHDQQNRKEKLREHLAWIEDEDLPDPERFGLKALFMLDEGKSQEAEKYLSQIIDRAINEKDIFLNAMIFGIRATAWMQQGNTKDAREDFSRAARFSGDSPHYQAAFAEIYLREGNLPRAIKYFQDALRQNPSHIYTNLRLAFALIQEGKKLEDAKKILGEFLDEKLHGEDEFSPPLRGMLYTVQAEYQLATNNIPQSNQWLSKSLQAYQTSAEAHNLAGRLAALEKDGKKALSEFARAIQLDPQLPKVYFDRSESLFLMGNSTEAISKLREFEQHLKPNVAYHVEAGNLIMRTGNLAGAMEEFQKAVTIDELSPEARFHVALCYQKMGEKLGSDKKNQEEKRTIYNDARQWYEDTLILPGGDRPEVYHMMGLIYLDSEDPNNAMDQLAKCVMMMQKYAEPSAKIAVVYEDIARVFKYLGGPEGEKQVKAYLAKAEALKAGRAIEDVEKEWAEKEKKEQAKSKPRRRKRR